MSVGNYLDVTLAHQILEGGLVKMNEARREVSQSQEVEAWGMRVGPLESL